MTRAKAARNGRNSSATFCRPRCSSIRMKAPILLSMFASLCFTGVAISQSPDQPRRDPERQPRENPEGRGPNAEPPRPGPRFANPGQAGPEVRRNDDRRPEPGPVAPWQNHSDRPGSGPRDGDRSQAPEIHRPHFGDRMEAGRRFPHFSRTPQQSPGGPQGLEELRGEIRMLSHQVQELREIIEAHRGGPQRFEEHRASAVPPSEMRRGPGPESRPSPSPMPPTPESRSGGYRMHREGGPRENPQPPPQGDRPAPRGDREPQGNPPR